MSDDFENKYRNWHTYWSYLKSAIRIAGCLTVMYYAPYGELLSILACTFFFAELIGILEEFV